MADTVLLVDRVPHPHYNGVTRYMMGLTGHPKSEAYRLDMKVLFWGVSVPAQVWHQRFKPYKLPWYIEGWNKRFLLPAGQQIAKSALLHFPSHNLPSTWNTNRQKCVLTVHGAAASVAPEWDTVADRAESITETIRAAQAARAHFITVSEWSKQEISQHYDIQPEQISVIYHGIDHDRFSPAPKSAVQQRLAYNLKLAYPYLLFLGPCSRRKNVVRLVQAFQQLKKQDGIPHRLVLAGRNHAQQHEVVSAAQKANILDSLVFLGAVDDATLVDLYCGADAFCFPSLYEGFGIPIIEAMACGTTVVTSNLAAMPEIAGGAASLIEDAEDVESIADALRRALQQGSYRENLIQKGLERAALFSWERTAHAHFQLYRRVIDT